MAMNKLGPAHTSTVEGVSRFLTLRKVIVIIVLLLMLKTIWSFFQSYNNELSPLDIGDSEMDEEFVFKPKSCVMEDGVCIPFSEAREHVAVKGLTAHGDHFYLNGLPFRIISGSFHYFRTHPGQWGDRLLKMKAAGLNTVTTYIPWNLHEKKKHEFVFTGMWDIAAFTRQVHKIGLYLIVRPGPYICSEWEYGGLPSWLLNDPAMKVRTSAYRPYLEHVKGYFNRLLPILAAFVYNKGGPIIAFQVENEYGSYSRDPDYMQFLVDLYKEHGLDDALLFTSDGNEQLRNGSHPGILATVNFVKRPVEKLAALKEFQPNKPMMVAEFWAGWFDHWGEEHHSFKPLELEETLRQIFIYNASVNFYMFVGGTNFEFWSGANNGSDGYAPTVTSYDYDAAVSENGDITPKYMVIRNTIKKMGLGPRDLPAIPDNSPKAEYGPVKIADFLDLYDLVKLVVEKPIRSQYPIPMEYLDINNGGGQQQGWLLYRTQFVGGKMLSFEGSIYDLALIMVNGKAMAIIDWSTGSAPPEVKIPSQLLSDSVNTLDILIENCGRVNYKWKGNDPDILNTQRKGIIGHVLLDDERLMNWEHFVLDFGEQFRQVIRSSPSWKPFYPQKRPTMYRASFIVAGTPADTHLNMENWTKGIAIINGFVLGRYWNAGPQGTLYVPAPLLLEGHNELLIFELDKSHDQVVFTHQPIL